MFNVIKEKDATGEQEVISSTQAKYEIWYFWHRDLSKKNSTFSGLSEDEFNWTPDEIEEYLFTTDAKDSMASTYTHCYWKS